jgi:RNA polymerase sigma-70 factor, ECF subfamily
LAWNGPSRAVSYWVVMTGQFNEIQLQDWMDRLGPQLLRLSASICHDPVAAEDVVQEAFVKLWRKPPEGGQRAVPSWMKRVVTNASINVLQRTKRPSKLPDIEHDPALRSHDRTEERLEVQDEVALVTRALDRMPDDKRILIVLRVQQQMSYAQIAETLAIPEGTVMSRLSRARKLLKELFEELQQGGSTSEEPEEAAGSIPFRRASNQE